MWHVWGTKEIQTGCWWGHLKEREQLEDLEVNERVILKWILKKEDGRTGLDKSGSGRDK
jgi:hypothetical protein